MLWTWVNGIAHFTYFSLQRGALRHSNHSWDSSRDLELHEINHDKEQTSAGSKVWARLLGFQNLSCSLMQIGLLLKKKLSPAQCGVCPVGFEVPDIKVGRGLKALELAVFSGNGNYHLPPRVWYSASLIVMFKKQLLNEWTRRYIKTDWNAKKYPEIYQYS